MGTMPIRLQVRAQPGWPIRSRSWRPGVRVDAAKTVLDRAGFAASSALEPDALTEKALHEMTAAELENFTCKGQRALDVLRARAGDVIEG